MIKRWFRTVFVHTVIFDQNLAGDFYSLTVIFDQNVVEKHFFGGHNLFSEHNCPINYRVLDLDN